MSFCDLCETFASFALKRAEPQFGFVVSDWDWDWLSSLDEPVVSLFVLPSGSAGSARGSGSAAVLSIEEPEPASTGGPLVSI